MTLYLRMSVLPCDYCTLQLLKQICATPEHTSTHSRKKIYLYETRIVTSAFLLITVIALLFLSLSKEINKKKKHYLTLQHYLKWTLCFWHTLQYHEP